jgi:hypothetical protein
VNPAFKYRGILFGLPIKCESKALTTARKYLKRISPGETMLEKSVDKIFWIYS